MQDDLLSAQEEDNEDFLTVYAIHIKCPSTKYTSFMNHYTAGDGGGTDAYD